MCRAKRRNGTVCPLLRTKPGFAHLPTSTTTAAKTPCRCGRRHHERRASCRHPRHKRRRGQHKRGCGAHRNAGSRSSGNAPRPPFLPSRTPGNRRRSHRVTRSRGVLGGGTGVCTMVVRGGGLDCRQAGEHCCSNVQVAVMRHFRRRTQTLLWRARSHRWACSRTGCTEGRDDAGLCLG